MEWLKIILEKATIKDGKLVIDSLMKSIKKEFPKHAVPKTVFNTLNDTKKDLERQIKDRDKQLKDLQEINKTTKEQYETKLQDLIIDAAIQTKLAAARHPELLISKFDKNKIFLSDDGTQVFGIDEQLTVLKETYKDLFMPLVKINEKG